MTDGDVLGAVYDAYLAMKWGVGRLARSLERLAFLKA